MILEILFRKMHIFSVKYQFEYTGKYKKYFFNVKLFLQFSTYQQTNCAFDVTFF